MSGHLEQRFSSVDPFDFRSRMLPLITDINKLLNPIKHLQQQNSKSKDVIIKGLKRTGSLRREFIIRTAGRFKLFVCAEATPKGN